MGHWRSLRNKSATTTRHRSIAGAYYTTYLYTLVTSNWTEETEWEGNNKRGLSEYHNINVLHKKDWMGAPSEDSESLILFLFLNFFLFFCKLLALVWDSPVLFSDFSLSIFSLSYFFAVDSRTSSCSVSSMTSNRVLLSRSKLMLIIFIHNWDGTITTRIEIKPPFARGVFRSVHRKYFKLLLISYCLAAYTLMVSPTYLCT